jgi:sugar/nucleoside kinase (ribokinase family)
MQYDITLIGNYTNDTIITANGTKQVDGGGFNYGAHAAIALGAKTAAITRLNKNHKHVIKNLENLGVDVFPTYTTDSTHIKLIYPTNDWDNRTLIMSKSAGSFSANQFDDIDSKIFLINASVRDEVDQETILSLSKKKSLIGIDLQGFIRKKNDDGTLMDSAWKEKEKILDIVYYLKADAVEAQFLSGETDLISSARTLASFGPKEIIITHKDGVLVYANNKIIQKPFKSKKIVGRSGRGDTCGASYVFMRLSLTPDQAATWAAAATSIKMESDTPLLKNKSYIKSLVKQYDI